jgi:hypothetical protein
MAQRAALSGRRGCGSPAIPILAKTRHTGSLGRLLTTLTGQVAGTCCCWHLLPGLHTGELVMVGVLISTL